MLFKKRWARVQETGELEATEIEPVEMAAQLEKRKRRWWSLWIWVVVAGLVLLSGLLLWWLARLHRAKPTSPNRRMPG